MNDFTINVRQIMEYPLKGAASEADAVLLQTGALGGPYAWTTTYGLVTGALDWAGARLGVGVVTPVEAASAQIFTDSFIAAPGGAFWFNAYNDDHATPRYWQNGPATILYMDVPTGMFQLEIFPPQPAGEEVEFRGNGGQFQVTPDGFGLFPYNTVVVARDPREPFEVATKGYVDDELEDAVEEINRRITNIYAELIGLYNTGTVWSFNGRRGNVTLFLSDVLDVGGAPNDSPQLTGDARAPTPPLADSSTRLATTAFVGRAIDFFADNGIVTSFNGRAGDVELLLSDLLSAGGAPVDSPHFIGSPTAPTPLASSNSTAIATTAFVHANLDILYGRVTGDIADVRQYLLAVIEDLERDLTGDISRIVRVQDEPPREPREGDLWWDSSKGKNGGNLFIWYDDPSSSQWVVANSGPPGPPGRPGEDALPRLPTRPSHEEPRNGDIWFDPDEWIIHVHAEGGFPQFGYGISGEWNGLYMNVKLFNWRNEVWSPTEPFGPVYVRNEPPESRPNPILGTFWFDRDNGRLSLWDGDRWRRIAEEE